MINIRQTSLYAKYIRSLGWIVETIDGVNIFIRKFPLLPGVIKIQRPDKLPALDKLKKLMRKYHANSITVEPNYKWKLKIGNWKLSSDPYIHTKTFHIDLMSSEKDIFNRFTPAKRRAVRRSQKNNIKIEISDNIEAFIKLKNKSAGMFLGFLTTYGFTRKLWKIFYPDHARVILAYKNNLQPTIHNSQPSRKYLAGILLLYIDSIAYYWMAAASYEGKKSFAPTLCVWEALKFSKKQGCKIFDFEGVYDERFPARQSNWQGFSKFKQGFGSKPIYYPQAFNLKL